MNDPDVLIDRIEQRRDQLNEVLAAYRQFREKLESLPVDLAEEIGGVTGRTSKPATGDLTGLSALASARRILTDHRNDPMHFTAIAKEAMSRGYRGRATGDPSVVESVIAKSFWAALSRASDIEPTGKGYYRLRQSPSQRRRREHRNGQPEAEVKLSLRSRIIELFREQQRPMRPKEVAAILESRGVETNSKHGLLQMVWSAFSKGKAHFELVEKGVFRLRVGV
jgi:hypothetical protein